ncbi:MAG TPA: molybdopterin-synthase adenylyltransferase MoeB [Candidatus Synoicihabitans sp.]|nr:molybdopterin-synthase adenylyltransferase MoeB [Candidatus Synoicihabitans sp.]
MSLSAAELARYSRHIMLPELGVAGQERLRAARVLVIGAGGLGSPAAMYLAAAGVGTVGLADFDTVEPHNLQRQILHDERSVGRAKAESAAARLRALNGMITVAEHHEAVSAENAEDLFKAYDVIVDGTDNFSSRYLNNDAAVLTQRPLVYGSVFKFSGQVAIFAPHQGSACYRCLFPEPPPPGSVPSCGEAGVLGALCGVVGSLQALEAIKVITGVGVPLLGELLTYDALTQAFGRLRVPRDPYCACCGPARTLTALDPKRYAAARPPAPHSTSPAPLEIDVTAARDLLAQPSAAVQLVDVREPYEVEICQLVGATVIPMRQIPERLSELSNEQPLLIYCHHGARSMRVTEFLRSRGFHRAINLAGGIDAWAREIDPTMPRY